MPYGVSSQMIEAWGPVIFDLSLNKQNRKGDPVRKLDHAATLRCLRCGGSLGGPGVKRRVQLPPKAGPAYVTHVSAVDGDGNETAGILPPELLAPLATFTGWNLRHPEQGAPGDLMSMMGSTLPFPTTAAAREYHCLESRKNQSITAATK